ncbi:hypothetical protein K474DRAFT_837746 [Panus rudis PR-1116 ss-1]|nr:hypothetical protein K474DRAFT_837746 [Panus rudis PR-1116 ss-1]
MGWLCDRGSHRGDGGRRRRWWPKEEGGIFVADTGNESRSERKRRALLRLGLSSSLPRTPTPCLVTVHHVPRVFVLAVALVPQTLY